MPKDDKIQIKIESIEGSNGVIVINAGGYIDQTNCDVLQIAIDKCLQNNRYKLIFNLENLVYMSSAGWGVLIGEIRTFRENGGDIKLIHMDPGVFNVYQLLEFNHIISDYPSMEEALESFRASERHAEIPEKSTIPRKPEQKKPAPEEKKRQDQAANNNKLTPFDPRSEKRLNNDAESGFFLRDAEEKLRLGIERDIGHDERNIEDQTTNSNLFPARVDYIEFNPEVYRREVDVKRMTLPEKIRKIVSLNPRLSTGEIKRMLSQPEFGGVKMGYFRLKAILRSLDLDTKEKRYRYYRSS